MVRRDEFVGRYMDWIADRFGFHRMFGAVLSDLLFKAKYSPEDDALTVLVNRAFKEETALNNMLISGDVNKAIDLFRENALMWNADERWFKLNPEYFGKTEWQKVRNVVAEIDFTNGVKIHIKGDGI